VLVADSTGVVVFSEKAGRLGEVARARLPGGVRAMRTTPRGIVALGEGKLTFIAIGTDGAVHIASTIRLDDAAGALFQHRGALLVAGRDGTRSYRIVRGQLRPEADYPLGHWSTSFLPGGADGVLLRRIDDRHLQPCRVERHAFDRRKFAKAFELAYRPKRP
jgi:hypothetical protein